MGNHQTHHLIEINAFLMAMQPLLNLICCGRH